MSCKYKSNTCRNLYCETHKWDCELCFYFNGLKIASFAEDHPFYKYIDKLDELHCLHIKQGCLLFNSQIDCQYCGRKYIFGYKDDDKMAWFEDGKKSTCETCHNVVLIIEEMLEKRGR